jgi:RNA polymerase sigma-70 factor, ECF subfamily
VIDPGAAPRVFGIPTAQLERFVADERNVLWSANGCLHAIARRQLALYYRRGRIEQRALARLHLEREPATPELIAEISERAGLSELRAELADALARLSPGMRAAVQLRIVDELPYPDLARSLGITEQAVRARVSRGLAKLAELLDAATIQRARTT